MTVPQHHFTPINGIQLHHLEWQGAEPPLVYIPGFISNAYSALKLAAAISPVRRVLALDLRGRGGSDKPQGQYSIDQHLQDILAWLEAQRLDRCLLAGHSFGAALAIFLAAHHPSRFEKLILLDGGAPPSDLAVQIFLAYHQNLTYDYPSVEAYIAPYRQLITLQPWTEEAEALTRANVIENPDGSATRSVPRHVVEAELAALDFPRWQTLVDLYPKITIPTLLIRAGLGSFGREDQHITDDMLKLMREQISDLRVYDMPNAGHTGILTVPDDGRDQALHDFVAG